jgi:hypothetical protein
MPFSKILKKGIVPQEAQELNVDSAVTSEASASGRV